MEDLTLDQYLAGELYGLSAGYRRVFDDILGELWHRTGLPEYDPSNPATPVNFLKELLEEWVDVDLWETETSGIEFNLQCQIDNSPELQAVFDGE